VRDGQLAPGGIVESGNIGALGVTLLEAPVAVEEDALAGGGGLRVGNGRKGEEDWEEAREGEFAHGGGAAGKQSFRQKETKEETRSQGTTDYMGEAFGGALGGLCLRGEFFFTMKSVKGMKGGNEEVTQRRPARRVAKMAGQSRFRVS